MIRRGLVSRAGGSNTSIRGLVVEYVVAIDVTRVRFPADALLWTRCDGLFFRLCASVFRSPEGLVV